MKGIMTMTNISFLVNNDSDDKGEQVSCDRTPMAPEKSINLGVSFILSITFCYILVSLLVFAYKKGLFAYCRERRRGKKR